MICTVTGGCPHGAGTCRVSIVGTGSLRGAIAPIPLRIIGNEAGVKVGIALLIAEN